MSDESSQSVLTIPMELDYSYEVQKIIFTGPLAEIVTGTLTSLDDTMLPPDLTEIRDYLFYNSSVLSDVELTNVTTVGQYAFSNCAIASLVMPNLFAAGLQSFSYNQMTSVTLPNLMEVSTQMFQRCENLTTADFATASRIGRLAFYYCENLETLILRSESMVQLDGTQQFSNTKIESGTGYIYVPDTLVSSYQADSAWAPYALQIRPISLLEVG